MGKMVDAMLLEQTSMGLLIKLSHLPQVPLLPMAMLIQRLILMQILLLFLMMDRVQSLCKTQNLFKVKTLIGLGRISIFKEKMEQLMEIFKPMWGSPLSRLTIRRVEQLLEALR